MFPRKGGKASCYHGAKLVFFEFGNELGEVQNVYTALALTKNLCYN